MKQGVLPFQYEQEKSSPGMTAMAGMMTYLELMHAAGLRSSVERHVGLRECGQGWTDSQVVSSLILLNLAGGESVVDLDVGRGVVQGASGSRELWDGSSRA